ncbi:hypothetical protein TNCT_115141 [Trichonephila clavata]|uniref:Uncharacterized protein n=1 Tax=Trichonephila clavata TaxID=2740835 RepID=A0A8X6LFX4_TRICU|nr:hypothetical protein TNCT_115141 [Trichonephila clavata]
MIFPKSEISPESLSLCPKFSVDRTNSSALVKELYLGNGGGGDLRRVNIATVVVKGEGSFHEFLPVLTSEASGLQIKNTVVKQLSLESFPTKLSQPNGRLCQSEIYSQMPLRGEQCILWGNHLPWLQNV